MNTPPMVHTVLPDAGLRALCGIHVLEDVGTTDASPQCPKCAEALRLLSSRSTPTSPR